MNIISFPLPTPLDIMDNSEIAMLYLLSESLEVSGRSIIAAHPIFISQDLSPCDNLSQEDEAARRLLVNLDRLARSITRYKKAVFPSSALSNVINSDFVRQNPRAMRKRSPSLRQLNLPFWEPEIPPF